MLRLGIYNGVKVEQGTVYKYVCATRDAFRSLPVIGWAMFIFCSSLFMRQVLNVFVSHFGRPAVVVLIWVSFAAAGTAAVVCAVKFSRNLPALFAVLAAGIATAASFEVAEERVHLVKFGILGWLIACSVIPKLGMRGVTAALGGGFLVAAADETLQWYLPYRVGDLRDVVFGAVGAVWGFFICFFATAKR